MRNHLGYVFIIVAATCWGLTGSVGRFVMEKGMDPLEAAFWRAALGSLFFLLYAARARILSVHSSKDWFVFIVFGACSLGGFFGSYQYAIQYGGAALAAVLLYTAPAWVAIFSRLFFGERLTPVKLCAIALSLAGVACISFSSAGQGAAETIRMSAVPEAPAGVSLVGITFGLLAGLLYSTHYVFSKTYLTRYTVYTIYGYSMLFGAIALFPFVSFSAKSPFDCLILFTLGFVCTFCAYWAYCEGMKRMEPTKAAVLATFEPVVATIAAWWIWHENFAFSGWIGAACVIAAVLVLVREPQKKTAGAPAPSAPDP